MSVRTSPRLMAPRDIYAIHEARATGMTPADIGRQYERSAVEIGRYLRPLAGTTMPTPFTLKAMGLPENLPEAFYWLGFAASAGRVTRGPGPSTLVLSINPQDVDFVSQLMRDMLRTGATYEFCHSSVHGNQLYVRHGDLSDALVHWGIGSEAGSSEVLVEFIPAAALPDFVRGLLEGQNGDLPGPRQQQVSLGGRTTFLEALRARLMKADRKVSGTVLAPRGHTGETGVLRFSGEAARALLRYMYKAPTRSTPRAAKIASTYAA